MLVSDSGSGSGSSFIPGMGIDEVGFLWSAVVGSGSGSGSGSGLVADGWVVDGEGVDLDDLMGSVLISLGLLGFSNAAMMWEMIASMMWYVLL